MWPPGRTIFGTRRIIWKKLGRGPLGVIHTKYQDSMPYGFRQDFFNVFHYISLWKTCDPQVGAIFGPRGIIWTHLVEVTQVMPHDPRGRPFLALWFQTRRFFMFFTIKAYVKHVTPGWGHWTNLVEVHQMMLHTKYQDSRPYDFRLWDKKIFSWFSLYKPM